MASTSDAAIWRRGSDDHAGAATGNPFRTAAALESSRDVRVKAIRRSARGPQLLWVDAKVRPPSSSIACGAQACIANQVTTGHMCVSNTA